MKLSELCAILKDYIADDEEEYADYLVCHVEFGALTEARI